MLDEKIILKTKWIIYSKEDGTGYVVKKNVMVEIESLLFVGAGAGVGVKNTWSLSKTDWLCNTGSVSTCW